MENHLEIEWPGLAVTAVVLLVTILLHTIRRANLSCTSSLPPGYKRIGLAPSQSNIRDEYDPSSHHPGGECRIKALFTYPIKSCAGIELDVANVVPEGIEYDRMFCFAEKVDDNRPWEARTLRNGRFSRLALVRCEIWRRLNDDGIMIISYPRPSSSMAAKLGMMLGLIPSECSFQVPLSPPPTETPTTSVKIWKDEPLSYDYARYIPSSFFDFIYYTTSPTSNNNNNHTRRLTLLRKNHDRRIFRNAPRKEELGFQPVTGFADAYPLHLVNLASVHDVARRCEAAIPRLSVRRFRANLIVTGPRAFDEDDWTCICIGGQQTDEKGVIIHTVAHTVRCRLPNVDPDTGIRHPAEPDRTMRSYRCIDPGESRYACLGMQLVPAQRGMPNGLDGGL